MPGELWRAALAGLPLLFLLLALLRWRWSGTRAGAAALIVTAVLALVAFELPAGALGVALLRAVLLSLDVLLIIWTALLLYQLVEATGAIRGIRDAVAALTEDHILQLLIIGVAFASFLQGVQGFGVPVAVTAPLLLGLGFAPLEAAAVPLLGHSWAVTTGTLASALQALRAVTGLPVRPMAIWIGVLLGLAAILTCFAVVHLHAGWRPMRRAFGAMVATGITMAGVHLILIFAGNWTVAASVASMAALAVGIQLARIVRLRGPAFFGLLPQWPPPEGRREPPRPRPVELSPLSFHMAFLPYYLLLGVVIVATFVPPVSRMMHTAQIALATPETVTGLGWTTPAASSTFQTAGHPGALILYTAAGTAVVFARLDHRPPWRAVWQGTASQGVPTTVTILSLVGVAMVMVYSGMTNLLAAGAARLAGPIFPFFSPFIGLLGTVVTGSNTNSNVLFGALQRDAAHLLRMDPVLMAALQSAGGALGSMVAPAKVVLATATTGLAGREGRVMRITGRYVLVLTGVLGLLGLIWTLVGSLQR